MEPEKIAFSNFQNFLHLHFSENFNHRELVH